MSSEHRANRRLSVRERRALSWVLSALGGQEAEVLRKQAEGALVIGGTPTMLDLVVPEGAQACPLLDGPLPVRAIAVGADDEPIGEILVWITGGRLSALEYAWYTDNAPAELPGPGQFRLG